MIRFRDQGWENLDEIEADELLRELRPGAELAVKMAVVHMEGAVKKTLTGTRSGRTYRVPMTRGRGGAARLHVASAPGEPPAVMFGALRNSIGHGPPRWRGRTVEAEFGPGLGQSPSTGPDPSKSYARRLEYGGVDSRGIRILPRPYMEPTVQREEPRVDRILAREAGSE